MIIFILKFCRWMFFFFYSVRAFGPVTQNNFLNGMGIGVRLQVHVHGYMFSSKVVNISVTSEASEFCFNVFVVIKTQYLSWSIIFMIHVLVKFFWQMINNGVPLLLNLAPGIFIFWKVFYFLAKITWYRLYCLYFHVT